MRVTKNPLQNFRREYRMGDRNPFYAILTCAILTIFLALPPSIYNSGIQYLLSGLSMLFVIASIKRKIFHTKFDFFLIYFFFIWNIITIFRGFYFDIWFLKKSFVSVYFTTSYLVPFLFFARPWQYFFRMMKKFVYIISWVISLAGILFYTYVSNFENRAVFLAFGYLGSGIFGYLLLNYFNTRENKYAILSSLTLLMLALIAAKLGTRGALVNYLITLTSCFTFAIYHIKNRNRKTNFILLSILGSCILVFLVLTNLNSFEYIINKGFDKAAYEGTRGGIFRDFFADFSSAKDWLIGRGLNGKIFRGIGPVDRMADEIENGYLYILLKGGLLYLVPYLLIQFRAIYFGAFKSNNLLCKSFALILIINLYDLFPFGLPDMSVRYMFLWIITGICYSKQMIRMSDQQVTKYLI